MGEAHMIVRWVVTMAAAAITGAGVGATFLLAPGGQEMAPVALERPTQPPVDVRAARPAVETSVHPRSASARAVAAPALGGSPSFPKLRASLVGTVMMPDPSASVALIQDLTLRHRPQREVRVGEMIQGRTLARIERAKVWLARPDGIEERLALVGEEGAGGPVIQRIGPHAFRINLRQLSRSLEGNVRRLLSQVTIHPHLEQFQLAGFEVSDIKPESLLHQAGLKARDIVKSVNGIRLDGMNNVRAAYHAARKSREVTMEISRQGRPETLSYELD